MKNHKLINKLFKNKISKLRLVLMSSLLLFTITLNSCDDFIEVAPEDVIDAGSFFANPDELIFAVNGVYAYQRNIFGSFEFFNLIEARSDNAAQNQLDQKERIETDTFEETPGNLLLVNVWTQNYILINNANNVINRAPNVPFDTSAEEILIARATGEAKFLRAVSYFILVNMFGDIPLRIEPTEDFDNATIPRSPVADVYAQIISDLEDAISVLPNQYTGGTFNEEGRVTRLAALSLLGKVLLQRGNNAAASAALENVIGQYTLLSDYSNLYAAGNDNTDESIFEISFNPGNQTGLGMNNILIPASEAAALGIVAGGFAGNLPTFPTQDVQDIYEVGDLRKEASITIYDNNGTQRPYVSKFIDLDAAGAGSDINMVWLRYADVLLMKAEADGESAASYELINQVRRRAFGLPSNTPNPSIDINESTPGTFLQKVMLERRREFVFEGHRYFDLKRLPPAEALSIINTHLSSEYTGIPTVQDYQLIYPIPQTEIDVSNGVITQNPGY